MPAFLPAFFLAAGFLAALARFFAAFFGRAARATAGPVLNGAGSPMSIGPRSITPLSVVTTSTVPGRSLSLSVTLRNVHVPSRLRVKL